MRRYVWSDVQKIGLSIIIATIVAGPVWGQEAPAPAKAPCTHSDHSISIAGIDIDTLHCLVSVDDQEISELNRKLRALRADWLLVRSDLEASRIRETALAQWFKEYFGTSTTLEKEPK